MAVESPFSTTHIRKIGQNPWEIHGKYHVHGIFMAFSMAFSNSTWSPSVVDSQVGANRGGQALWPAADGGPGLLERGQERPGARGAETKWLGEKDFMGFCNICGDLLEFQ
jgi:hypothetical protein